MNAEILAVGTELLLGDILNTNAQYLSKQLAQLGISVYYQTVVGDNKERLLNAYKNAFERADIVITTGGLGPTDDDLTKETAAQYFNKKMILDDKSLEIIEQYFKKRGKMPETNKKQAYIPEGAKILSNTNGTAPGCIIEENGKILIMLPGPPNETVPMFEKSVMPYLKQKQDYTLVSKTLHLSGVGESAAAEKIRKLMQESTNPTIAPYAKTNEMFFRITAKGNSIEEAEKIMQPAIDEIYNKLGEFIYGEDDITLVESVMKEIIKKGMTISVAESCTGGMLMSEIVNFSGISSAFIEGFVTYSNESKIKRLNVKKETIEKYGAVSEQTAIEMAEGVMKNSNTDIGISTTGIAGPDGGTDKKPVGLVFVAVSIKGNTKVKEFNLKGDRQKIRSRIVTETINMLRNELKNY